MKKLFYILFVLLYLMQPSLWASTRDSASIQQYKLFFPLSRTEIDDSYLSNKQTLQHLHSFLQDSSHCVDSVAILSYSSPEGPYWINKRYAEQRGISVRNYLQNALKMQLPDSLIRMNFVAENWAGLCELVQDNYFRADREKLLRLLYTRRIDDMHRKLEIQKLDEGRTWNYLLQYYMPQLRYATWMFVFYTTKSGDEQLLQTDEPEIIPQNDVADYVETDTIIVKPITGDSVVEDSLMEVPIFVTPDNKKTRWAIKTNLLYDAATLLNISAELPFMLNGQSYSIVAQHQFPWWDFKDNHRIVRFLSTGLEGRWWVKPHHYEATSKRLQRDALTGHFVGLYGLTGKWDFQWDRKVCYQGDFWSIGLVYGYSMPIAKRLNLEFTIAVGYASIPYQHYIPSADWQTLYKDLDKQGTWNYFGPTRAEVSLVLPIWGNTKRGGGR